MRRIICIVIALTVCNISVVTLIFDFCTDFIFWGTALAQWLRCCATNRKVAGSIPGGVIGIFH